MCTMSGRCRAQESARCATSSSGIEVTRCPQPVVGHPERVELRVERIRVAVVETEEARVDAARAERRQQCQQVALGAADAAHAGGRARPSRAPRSAVRRSAASPEVRHGRSLRGCRGGSPTARGSGRCRRRPSPSACRSRAAAASARGSGGAAARARARARTYSAMVNAGSTNRRAKPPRPRRRRVGLDRRRPASTAS